jgi:hypothetical protein
VSERARVRINLAQRELEVEGPEAFVDRWAARIEELLEALDAPLPAMPAGEAPEPGARAALGTFGEFLQLVPSSATETDKILAAGYFVQQQSGDDAFGTGEASRKLTDHGVKVGNPSQCVRQSLAAKRVFMVQRGRYRVSQGGRGHLRRLLGDAIPD